MEYKERCSRTAEHDYIMAKRTKNQNTLELGDWNTLCDVCGFKFKASDLKERWDGLMVCHDDWEPRHPSDFFRARKEDQSVPWSRPEDAGTEDGPTYTYTPPGTPDGTFDGSL